MVTPSCLPLDSGDSATMVDAPRRFPAPWRADKVPGGYDDDPGTGRGAIRPLETPALARIKGLARRELARQETIIDRAELTLHLTLSIVGCAFDNGRIWSRKGTRRGRLPALAGCILLRLGHGN
jgi:hypothetical protein